MGIVLFLHVLCWLLVAFLCFQFVGTPGGVVCGSPYTATLRFEDNGSTPPAATLDVPIGITVTTP